MLFFNFYSGSSNWFAYNFLAHFFKVHIGLKPNAAATATEKEKSS